MSDTPETSPLEDVGGVEKSLVVPPELPVLPLRDTVLFPNSFMPLAVAISPYGPMVFTVAARPAFGDGAVVDRGDARARENVMELIEQNILPRFFQISGVVRASKP